MLIRQFIICLCLFISCYGCKSTSQANKIIKNKPINYEVAWETFNVTFTSDKNCITKKLKNQVKTELNEIFITFAKLQRKNCVVITFKQGIFFNQNTLKTFLFEGECFIFNKKKKLSQIKKNKSSKTLLIHGPNLTTQDASGVEIRIYKYEVNEITTASNANRCSNTQ